MLGNTKWNDEVQYKSWKSLYGIAYRPFHNRLNLENRIVKQ